MKAYDGMIIFPSSLKDDVLEGALERVRGEIEKLEGSVDDTTVLGERTFARPMKKRHSGRYVRMFFRLDPARIDGLLARLKLNEQVFRIQILVADEKKVAAVKAAKAAKAAPAAPAENKESGATAAQPPASGGAEVQSDGELQQSDSAGEADQGS